MPVTKIDSSNIVDSGVTAGTYTAANITVNAQGIITSAANGSGGGSISINALTDVDTTTTVPAEGEGLIWNSTSNQWIPGNINNYAIAMAIALG